MTDDELRRVYEEAQLAYLRADFSFGDDQPRRHAAARGAALRAVFEAGARAQRDMPPTPEMSAAGFSVHEGEHDPAETYRAMQRAAPLAKVE